MRIRVAELRPCPEDAGTRRAFIDLFLPDLGLKITGFAFHEDRGQKWISLPSRPVLVGGGKTEWRKMLAFSDKEAGAQFQVAALAAVAAYQLAQAVTA